ncbi:N-formylglutamate amidohydrolase [Roseinatronobacter sp.]|uniref:N-formylglutamate amidohydrolase n=1 Tax=Roseinatronobacter sp. TaxID=1945755 RepID=UPI003F6FDEEA
MNAFSFFPANMATSAVVFASPHSGRNYAPAFLTASVLDELALRSSEDAYVDLFLQNAPESGAPVLLGGVPRAYVDYNRAATELDPALIADLPKTTLNPRIMSGLGVIPRVVAGARAIYAGKIPRAEAEFRLNRFWHPYHARLTALMDEHRRRFGRAILLDMHSMPRDATNHDRRFAAKRPDIVLGDRFGAACAPDISDQVASIFTSAGFRVARNAPFAGAYIAQRYGTPSTGQHVVQIEIDRGLYLDETTVAPSRDFDAFARIMGQIIPKLSEIGRSKDVNIALAAE